MGVNRAWTADRIAPHTHVVMPVKLAPHLMRGRASRGGGPPLILSLEFTLSLAEGTMSGCLN